MGKTTVVTERVWHQADASSASYNCVTLGNPILSCLLCEMGHIKYLHLGVGMKVERSERNKCFAPNEHKTVSVTLR